MATPEHQIQGSDAWHQYRATRGNASEVAALMKCSPFYPRTPAELFDVKIGRQTVHENEAMRRGSRLEEPARDYMERTLECAFSPHVSEWGRISASLDGIDFGGTTILEIKVPMKGQQSDTFQHVAKHRVPPKHYWWQVQQQLLCSGAEQCIFAVCAADESEAITTAVYCTVEADEKAQQSIAQAWEWFLSMLDADQRPEDDKPEYVERNDDAWAEAANRYQEAKKAEAEAKKAVEAARKELVELAGDTPAYGCGVKLQHIWTQGSIDYKAAVPEGIDLEQYRKEGRWQTRIDVEK
ncbi:MAG: lambda-exonuclease family protein [Salinirussus sp.]